MSASLNPYRAARIKSAEMQRRLGECIDALDMTHVLRMPLATSKSRPQFLRSLLSAKSDPTASNIHPKAFGTPDTQSLTLCSLSLTTPLAIQRAKAILDDIRMDDSLYKQLQPETNPSSPSPFLVSVKGLLPVPDEILHRGSRLYAPVTVHAGDLSAFAKAVLERFYRPDL